MKKYEQIEKTAINVIKVIIKVDYEGGNRWLFLLVNSKLGMP